MMIIINIFEPNRKSRKLPFAGEELTDEIAKKATRIAVFDGAWCVVDFISQFSGCSVMV